MLPTPYSLQPAYAGFLFWCPLCSVLCHKGFLKLPAVHFHAPPMPRVTVIWWFSQIHSITVSQSESQSIGTAVTPLITAYVPGDCFCRVPGHRSGTARFSCSVVRSQSAKPWLKKKKESSIAPHRKFNRSFKEPSKKKNLVKKRNLSEKKYLSYSSARISSSEPAD
jgi:hypothetical protein